MPLVCDSHLALLCPHTQNVFSSNLSQTPRSSPVIAAPQPRDGGGLSIQGPAQLSDKGTWLEGCMSTSSVGVSPVGEPPDVSQAHAVPDAGEEEIQTSRPVPSVFWALGAQLSVLAAGAHQELWCHRLSERGCRNRRGWPGMEGRGKAGEEGKEGSLRGVNSRPLSHSDDVCLLSGASLYATKPTALKQADIL